MKDLQIWEPFRDLIDWDDFFAVPRRHLWRSKAFDIQQMPIEVSEKDGQILVKAKVPGAKKDDVKVTLTDDSVTICYKKEDEKKEERKDDSGTVIHYSEFRSMEEITRTITLPKQVDSSKGKAEVKNGILTISAPVLSMTKEKSLEIEGD